MTTQSDAQTQLAWPLPAAQEAHTHLTWAEWAVQQATSLAYARRREPIAQALARRSILTRLNSRSAERLTWPLPATLLPNARLSWAAWLDGQSRKPVAARQDAAQTTETAA